VRCNSNIKLTSIYLLSAFIVIFQTLPVINHIYHTHLYIMAKNGHDLYLTDDPNYDVFTPFTSLTYRCLLHLHIDISAIVYVPYSIR